jgi:small nuclear ribonucleoprotein (snRNP)-like protein
MLSLVHWRLKVTLNDGRALTGQMLAFDRHMNLVLAECEEFRRVRPKKKAGEADAGPMQEMKRALGLVILRGETIVSISVEGPPPAQDEDKKNAVCDSFSRAALELIVCASTSTASRRSWSRHACGTWDGNDASECARVVYAAGAQVLTSLSQWVVVLWRRPCLAACRPACPDLLPASALPACRPACRSRRRPASLGLLRGASCLPHGERSVLTPCRSFQPPPQ